jgi:hypothetical protein
MLERGYGKIQISYGYAGIFDQSKSLEKIESLQLKQN